MGNVFGGVQVSFKDEPEAHGVAAHGRHVHGGPQRVLKEHRGSRHCTELQTTGASRRQHWLQKFTAFVKGLK